MRAWENIRGVRMRRRADMQELKEVEVTVVQVPKYVKYECPHCGREVEVDYDDFNDDRMSDYWPEWEGDTVTCDECGTEFASEMWR